MRQNVLLIIVAGILICVGCNSEPSTDTSKLPQPVNVTVQPTDGQPAQIAAADALGRIGQPAAQALSESLADADPIVRLQSCRALAYMGAQAKDAVPALVRALSDPEQAVREEAAAALGQVGQPAAPAVPALMQMLRGK
ncbi:MAG TPA: HEAT repeat domain-containing protein [Pirellulales bacterium]|nr:HEAT repeat domain-containing protein [Pirellulales bacterium]